MREQNPSDARDEFERMVRRVRRALADDRPVEDEDDLLRDEDFQRRHRERPN